MPPSKRYSGMKSNPHKKDYSKKEMKKPDGRSIKINHEYIRRTTSRKTIKHKVYEREIPAYLKFYELLIEYHSLRLNIKKIYLRIMMYFYEGYTFKRAEFIKYSKMISSSDEPTALDTFLRLGLVRQLTKIYHTERNIQQKKTTKIPFYTISKQMMLAIKRFYIDLEEMDRLNEANPDNKQSMSEELAQLYNSYVRKIGNYKKGIGQVDEIVKDIEAQPEIIYKNPNEKRGRPRKNT